METSECDPSWGELQLFDLPYIIVTRVPFAEPPINEHRFKKPTPKRPWNGTLSADTLAPACFQGRDGYDPNFWGSEMWNANTPVSEDCLYVNIWAPAEA